MLKRFRPDKVVLSLDSDILFALAYIRKIRENPELENEKEESSQDVLSNSKKREIIEKIYDFYEKGELEFFVSPPVYMEARNAKYATDFIRECAYMPRVIVDKDGNKRLEGMEEVEELAREYVKPLYYIDKKDGIKKKTSPAMISKPNASNYNLYEPSTDAYIMAWSSVYGFELLTNNEDHFISYGRYIIDKKTGDSKKDAYRRKAIREINEKKGWIVSQKDGVNMTAAPHSLYDYEMILNYNSLKIHSRNVGDLDLGTDTIDFLEENWFRIQDEDYYQNDDEFDDDLSEELELDN